jgi:hypothetical protein
MGQEDTLGIACQRFRSSRIIRPISSSKARQDRVLPVRQDEVLAAVAVVVAIRPNQQGAAP